VVDSDQVIVGNSSGWPGRAALYALFSNILSVLCSPVWGEEVFALPMDSLLQDIGCNQSMTDMWQEIVSEAGPPGSKQRKVYYDHLGECFQRNFLVPLKGEMIPLGASAYLGNDQVQEGRMAFFEGLYHEFSFDWRSVFAGTKGVWPNEPEHAVLILTMLAIISQQIASAVGDSDRDDRLPGYLGLLREISAMAYPWLAQCFARVASEAIGTFYRFFGGLMREFLSTDREQWDLDLSA